MTARRDPIELLEAFQDVSDGVFAVDEDMRIVFWNWPATQIFGVSATTALGRRCDEVVQGYESSGAQLCSAECRVMGCAVRGRAAETYDLVRSDPAGHQQWLNVTIVVLRGDSRASTLAVHLVRDVTAHRGVEQRSSEILRGLSPAGASAELPPITRREAEVLRMLACGASNRTIASTLGISSTTVRNHIEHLLAKLGVHSKLEAVVYAAQRRLV
jgi:PAS domain S-box-containing protein